MTKKQDWRGNLLEFLAKNDTQCAWIHEPHYYRPKTTAELDAEINEAVQYLHLEGVEVSSEEN